MKINALKYPTRYELNQALSEYCNRDFLDSLAQENGVFISKVLAKDLADELSIFFYDNVSLDKIRDFAHRKNSKNTLSGFIITSNESNFDPYIELDKLRVSNKLDIGMEISPVTKETSEGIEIFRGGVNYLEYKPGRIEFLQEDKRSFNFSFQKTETNSFQFLVECNKSNDAKVIENLIKNKTGKDVRIETLDSTNLTPQQTIAFFDELAKSALGSDWRFIEVKKINIKKDDSEDESVKTSDLGGITQAILEGKDLRGNNIVLQFEKNNYRFVAMTYEYENKSNPFLIQVRAEFKSRPKVFEISITKYQERQQGTDEIIIDRVIDAKLEMDYKIYAWKKSKEIYNNL